MTTTHWPTAAATRRADGGLRRVGVEFELQGLAVGALARVTASALGGTMRQLSAVEYLVSVPGADEYRVEVDYELLKVWARRQSEAGNGTTKDLEALLVDLLTAASSVVVPCEVVSPPIAMDKIAHPMEQLVKAIRRAGGKGTRHSPLYAFGLHLNVEPPRLDARTVVAYMKAFVCLYDWVIAASEIDVSRRITPYIDPYPAAYEDLLLDPRYWPDWDQLTTDYLYANPTRNRALDMLPMLAERDQNTVQKAVADTLVKPRPAFHYRLANCEIDDPDWSIAVPWRQWLQIEHLAANADALDECCAALVADHRQRLMRRLDTDRWCATVTQWLRNY